MNRLQLDRIGHAYDGQPVLHDVSVTVGSGEIVCLLGSSGCGKTTLLRLAAGLERVQRGRVSVGAQVVADGDTGLHLPPEKRNIGLMFQDYALFPHLTVAENVAFGLRRQGPDVRARVDAGLARLGLAAYAGAYPHTLSGGQQQRVALLRALAPAPRVLLLDEPFSGLDVGLRARVRERALGLLRDAHATTLMVTHDPEEAMAMGDRIAVMDDGRLLQVGTPQDLYLRPADAFVAALFGPVNRLRGVAGGGRVTTGVGAFAAPGLAEGTPVQVLIRPEGLRLVPSGADAAASARVTDVRLLGRTSHVRLSAATGNGNGLSLDARVPGPVAMTAGDAVDVEVDPRHVFVFPAA